MSEQELRQWKRMRQILVDYRSGFVGLRDLVSELEFLAKALGLSADFLQGRFWQNWGSLEELSSAMVVYEVEAPTPEIRSVISEAVSSLWDMVNGQIQQG